MEDKALVSGYVTLFIGVALLAFTFVSAYLFLSNDPSITGSPDLVTVFGDALAPLIVTCIRIMYLGVMGWIGSVLTIRGVQLVTQLKREAKPEIKPIAPTSIKTPIPKTPSTVNAEKTGKIRKVKTAK
ncbi:MAG: hypothetical protein OEY39_05185 [Candidatus Bathyarchaeota archaeon]|nr:hypothetical protein [Candidatus Bathyarchaeota archaeon]